uniref:putative DNA modification/repair radical SAM protein n=1 Tax=uncultured Bartonella sp. TaxID=104108 RepID=UPI0025CE7B7E
TPDGRCVSLLKILLTNFCIFDCAYCVNRSSSNVERARFTTDEVVFLTLEFYRRNYIEGLFLSSGIIRSPDQTMEELVEVARDLRTVHHFGGYIHLKTIPDASEALIKEAGRYADRLSINVELPTEKSINRFAPQKKILTIKQAMANVRIDIEASKDATLQTKKTQRFAPAGQSTQMIIGADDANDATILQSSAELYSGYRLKRVYYSAFSPIPDASNLLPVKRPPLLREHRLYQADWLYRFYGFAMEELTAKTNGGMLELEFDPKLAWALQNRHLFPVDINKADKEMLLRVPGLGVRNVKRILAARRFKRLDFSDLKTFHISLEKIKPFVTAERWTPKNLLDSSHLTERFRARPTQLDLFSS